ncbi:MAG: pyridoxal 5'-phosphate synthase glutaminase subunit PdxT [Thermoplasmata archaeon]|nr:pyridoxal 5'-phosphate synthase glutaminase subunit PdxT [Thermoplasmata archaeon]
MKVGVLSVQGAVQEHLDILQKALSNLGVSGSPIRVRRLSDLREVSGLIVPGGESTTISKLLQKNHLYDPVRKEAEEGMPIMGTCAGCILLAKEGDEAVMKTQTQLLSIMDMAVVRNAFGRQRESFEADLEIEGLDSTFRGVFIRAPAISKVWGNCSVLSNFNGKIVMANQGSMLALAFHPELSGDTRIHELFLDMI